MKRSFTRVGTRVATRVAAALGTLAVTAGRALADVVPENGYGRPTDVSLDGWRSDWLFNVTTVSITVLFLIMAGILVWTSLMHSDKPGRHAHYEHGIGRKHLMLTAVISSIIFFGVDGTLLYNSFVDLKGAFWKWPTKAETPVEVEVFAQQWAWNVRYPGADGKFNTPDDVLTLNELHIPVNRPVMIKLKSKDVIHSFYLPNFRTKQDAFPGAVTQLWFQSKQTGDFEIGCAQHCGVSHYKMKGLLHVTSNDDFNAWLKEAEVDAKRRFDEADAEAHWGWDWES
jgi:cytochrome c oxidase subunit 2